MKKDKTKCDGILDKEKIEYSMMSYDPDDGKIDGVSVAEKLGREVRGRYKTLHRVKGIVKIICVYYSGRCGTKFKSLPQKAVSEKKI